MVKLRLQTETMLLTTLSVPQNLATGGSVTVRAEAKAGWLECKDVCIPGGRRRSTLTLPVRESRQTLGRSEPVRGGPRAGSAAAGRRRGAGNARRQAAPAGAGLAERPPDGPRRFYPLEEARIEPSAAQILKRGGTRDCRVPDRGDGGRARLRDLKGVIVANGGLAVPSGWTATVEAPVSAGVVAASVFEPPAQVRWASTSMTLLIAFGGALLGGLILNLMPCVFPVLSLKLIGAFEARARNPVRWPPWARIHGRRRAFVRAAGCLAARPAADRPGARLGLSAANAVGDRSADRSVLRPSA